MSAEIDTIQKLMGAYGRYQFRLTLIIFMVKFSIAFNQMAIVFLAPKLSFTCNGVVEKCPCRNPVYNSSEYPRTLVTQWQLICGRKWLISFTQSLFQLGILFGSIIFGSAADRYGRRKPLLVAVVTQLVSGVAIPFINNYWTFTFLRFMIGMAVGGTMVTTFVIIMEFTGIKYREIISALYQFPFNVGHMILPGIAYFVRDYTHFSLVITSASFILLTYFVLIPETPRWFLSMKRTEDAVEVITRVATVNNLPTDIIRSQIEGYIATMDRHHLVKTSVFDLFRTPNLRKRIIIMSINWLACGYCFYGVSQYVGQLHGNVFLNVLMTASFSGIGTLISIPLMKIMNRKTMLISLNLLAAGCLILLSFLQNHKLSVILAVIGTMASFIEFVLVYLYCGELFPTVVRNAAIGFCSMTARIGSVIAPFVIDTADLRAWLPPLLFAAGPLVAGLLAFILPETKGHELMNTLEEAEVFGIKK